MQQLLALATVDVFQQVIEVSRRRLLVALEAEQCLELLFGELFIFHMLSG